MRIKIIGENNCARATRHLLRKAGFAVSEYLPAEVITQAPHSGYAITIDLAPAPLTPPAAVPNAGTMAGKPVVAPYSGTDAGLPSYEPGTSTHGQPAENDGEASAIDFATADASSPAFVPNAGTMAGRPSFVSCGDTAGSVNRKTKGAQAEACATGGGHIHFDSVDSELEAAILRHVTQLAAGPVIVDRPGGVVHSDRELRIVVPRMLTACESPRTFTTCESPIAQAAQGEPRTPGVGDDDSNSLMDEAAAIAVEFGVLRGLLDLMSPPQSPNAGKSAGDAESTDKKKWWKIFRRAGRSTESAPRKRTDGTFGVLLLLTATLFAFAANANASPRNAATEFTHIVEARGVDGAYLHLEAALAPAQGQFGTGQVNLALIGGSAISSSLYDSGNTALKVNCVVGCGATSSFGDNAAFTAGTTAVNNISAVFNDSITALTSGNAGALRSTTDRMLYVNIGKLGGTALSGANVVDGGNTAFRVNCVVGCSASAGFTDNSAFTAGTTTESNVGGVFNDGLSTLSSGNAAAARITSSRAIHVNLRNASGTEIGTASNPVRTDPTGTTTQPVTIQSNAAVNFAQVNGVTVTTGNGVSGTGVQRVAIASDNTAFSVNATLSAETTKIIGETIPVQTATTTDSASGCYLQSAASTNATNCKASAGNFYGFRAVNTTATLYYLRMYNASGTPTCSSATGFVESIPIPASATGAGIQAVVPVAIGYSTGIAFCFTGGGSSTDNTNAATGVYLTLYYK